MMTAQQTDEKTIFLNALERATFDEQRAYLESECAGNSALLARIMILLKAHHDSFGPLDSPRPEFELTSISSIPENTGDTIGPYKLLEQIGEGGMGVVYMAEQKHPVERRVALKIIKPGMDTRQVIARFEAERQALAMMDHPNIAKVLDAGQTDSGRPYFVMELVKGMPVTQYCDEQHLTPKERLELFVPICQAVQHAHQKGIIHRDLKPSNILIAQYDDKPVPKIIDFGVAKAISHNLTEKTMFTQYGQIVGTLEYMSPEQARFNQLDVDTRSDIYSLGVLLYELLTGETPFDKKRLRSAAFDELLRIIRDEDPPRMSIRLSSSETLANTAVNRKIEPKKLSLLVRGELDWIVMKALEKDRARRYETASKFAEDVQRHLNDEAVAACPPSATYKFRKFARRNSAVIATSTIVALSLIIGTSVATWQALQATRERNRAVVAEKIAHTETGHARADRERAKAAESIANMRLSAEKIAREQAVTEAAKATAISDLLQEMISSAYPTQKKGAEYTVRQLLDDASLRLQERLQEQPEIEATLHAAIGNAYRRLSLTEKAELHLLRALAIRRTMAADSPEPFAESLLDFGQNLYLSGHPADAESSLREALAIYNQHGVRNAKVIETLSALQLCLDESNRHDDAEAVANEALSLGRELFPDGHGEIASILRRLADMKCRQGKFLPAEALIRESLSMHQRWHGDEHSITGWSFYVLGKTLMYQERYAEAETNYRKALTIFRKHHNNTHRGVHEALARLRYVLLAQGDHAGLALLIEEQTTVATDRIAIHPNDPEEWLQQGIIEHRLNRTDEAVIYYLKAAELSEDRLPEIRLRVAEQCSKLARSLRVHQKHELCERMFRSSISLRDSLGKAANLRLAQSDDFAELADVLRSAKRLHDAEAAARTAIDLKQQLATDFPSDQDYQVKLALAYVGLGGIVSELERVSEAGESIATASEMLSKLATDDTASAESLQRIAHAQWLIGDSCVQLKRYDESEQVYRQALTIFERIAVNDAMNPRHRQDQLASYKKLADLMLVSGQTEDAGDCYRQVLELNEQVPTPIRENADYRYELGRTLVYLGCAFNHGGNFQESEEAHVKALALWKQLSEEYPDNELYRMERAHFSLSLAILRHSTARLKDALSPCSTCLQLNEQLVRDFAANPVHQQRLWHARGVLLSLLTSLEDTGDAREEIKDVLNAGLTAEELHCVSWKLMLEKSKTPPSVARRAVELSRKAVELKPESGDIWNIFGVAHYRANQWQEAIDALDKSTELREGRESGNSFYIAMSLWQLNEKEAARQACNRAVQWMEENHPQNPKLLAIRAEVEELMKPE